MNKKFFAALASATMAFTASGSIAVFADDFVEEKNPVVDNGDVKPIPTEVVWNKENFGVLAKGVAEGKVTLQGGDFKAPELNKPIETAELAKIQEIILTTGKNFKGEIKGLEYFTGLTTFNSWNGTLTNKTLDFSANTKLKDIRINDALTGITLPNPTVEDEEEYYSLETLYLVSTELTSLDLSAQEELDAIHVYGNKNLKEVVLPTASKKYGHALNKGLELQNNALETVNLDYLTINNKLDLSGNHIGTLDLSKTDVIAGTTVNLANQKFYVSETLKNVNLNETFEGFNAKNAEQFSGKFEDGVLTLDASGASYAYNTHLKCGSSEVSDRLGVQLIAANPMNRLYNPNSGEHFYTADIKEKEALVALGWNDEGYGWVAPKMTEGDKVVYRLYNPNAGDHHYTVSASEKNTLVSYGWKYEGEGWKSAAKDGNTPVYRQYNPYANGAGSHNYTTDKAENDYLVSLGWTPEGTAWYAYQ